MIQPDLSLPNIPEADTPITNSNGDYVGSSQCQSKFSNPRPPVPYGQQVQNSTNALWFEDGFKEVVGYLTEGRYLVAEKGGSALTNSGERGYVTATPATDKHDSKHQRWVIHYTEDAESEIFTISSALDGRWLGARGALLDSDRGASAEPVRITFLGNGLGYAVQYVRGNQYIDVNHVGQIEIATQRQASNLGFKLFSVTYHD